MYTIYDYAYNGYLYLNNIIRPRNKRLSQLMIYSTTACQSRCKHCSDQLACEKQLDTMLAEYDTLSYIPFSVQKK